MAKAPKPGTTPNSVGAQVVTITVNGESYPFRPTEISAVDAAALRQSTGMSLRSVLDAAARDPDIDVVAALLWLSRRQNGEPRVKFEHVAAEIHYTSKYEIGVARERELDEDPNSPEA